MKDINFGDIPVLSGLDRINLARLIPSFEQVNAKSGEILFRQGEPGDVLFIIIIDGIVRVFWNRMANYEKSPLWDQEIVSGKWHCSQVNRGLQIFRL